MSTLRVAAYGLAAYFYAMFVYSFMPMPLSACAMASHYTEHMSCIPDAKFLPHWRTWQLSLYSTVLLHLSKFSLLNFLLFWHWIFTLCVGSHALVLFQCHLSSCFMEDAVSQCNCLCLFLPPPPPPPPPSLLAVVCSVPSLSRYR